MLYLIILFLLNFFKHYCGEDEYQKNRFIEKPPYIYSKIYLKQDINNIYDKINETLNEYFINRWPKIDNILVYKEVDEFIPSETHILEIYKQKNVLHFYCDHRYFSGYFFLILGEKLFNNKSKHIIYETYIPFLSEFYIIKFIYYYYCLPKITKLPFVKHKKEMRREHVNFNIPDIKSLYNSSENIPISRKYYSAYHLLTTIYDKVKFNRPMRVLIPLAFKTTSQKYNTVGCIIVDFNKEHIQTFVYKVNQLAYQAHATNLLQSLLNYGKKTRSSVDIVLSMGFLQDDNDLIDNFFITYDNIADYPIYCMSITFNNKVFSTVTYMNEI